MKTTYPPLENFLVTSLFTVGLILYICLASPLMTVIHIPYGEATGSAIFKIHLATYLFVPTFILAHLLRGNPVRSILSSLSENKGLATYLIITMLLLVYSVVRYGASGVAFMADTLIMPAICAQIMLMFSDQTQKRIFLLVVGIIVVNSLMALLEAVLQKHFIPYTIAGKPVIETEFFRATALLGHPLKNALITGTVLLAALNLRIGLVVKTILIGTLFLALLSFGGRTSFALAGVFLTLYFSVGIFLNLIKGRYNYMWVMGGIIGIFFTIGMIAAVMLGSNIGERIMTKLTTYDNSASVRIHNWDALNFMSTSDIIFGLSPQAIDKIVIRLGQMYQLQVIENFWLALLMQLGAIGLSFFIIGLISAVVSLWKRSEVSGRIAILFFFIAASSNNALSTKNSALIILFVLLIGASAYRRVLTQPLMRRRVAPQPVVYPRRPVRASA